MRRIGTECSAADGLKNDRLKCSCEITDFSCYAEKHDDCQPWFVSDFTQEDNASVNCYYICPCGANDKGGSNLSEGVYKYNELRQAILDYFNSQDIHSHTNSDIEHLWRAAKIKVNKEKNGWILEDRTVSHSSNQSHAEKVACGTRSSPTTC